MKTHTKLIKTIGRACLLLAGVSLFAAPAFAQSGSVEGRVLNAGNGSYLGNARVTVQGTNLETQSNSFGDFRLDGVPAGDAKITAFYTGLASQTTTVKVAAGESTHQDFNLSSAGASNDTVMLDPLTVASKRDTDAAAIAINEQRFAANIKNVVSTDAFGDIAEGNVGDFVKFLPGVTIDYVSPDARTVSVRGVPANYTSLTLDGFPVASANSSTAGRTIELEQISLNNSARIEVTKSRSPDIAASALGGSVNLIPRSAFERAKASLDYRTFLSINGDEKHFDKTRGPGESPSHKIKPGFDVTYVNPVNKNFGYTVSLLESDIFYPQHRTAPGWAPGQGAQVGSTTEIPVMRNYQVQDGPKNNQRESVGTTLDWRFTPTDVLSASFQWSFYNSFFGNRPVTYTIGNVQPASYDATNGTFVHGGIGAGSVAIGGTSFRHKYGYTYQPGVNWRHTGPIWKLDGGFSFSHATNHYHDSQDNRFSGATLTLRGAPATTATGKATVNFDAIDQGSYLVPSITVLDATGTTKLDLANPSNYNITNGSFNPADSSDAFKTARFNAKRDLNLKFPFAVKAGIQIQEQTRDIRLDNPGTYTFVGPDHTASTADDNASLYDVLDPQYTGVPYLFGTPAVVMPNPTKLLNLYKAHPDYFTPPTQATSIQNLATNSKWFRERIFATYLMGDMRLVENRLRIVGGIRFERTEDQAAGLLDNIAAAKGITDPTAAAQARYGIRAAKSNKTYSAGYPSLDAQFNVTQSLLARVAYSRAIGRPDLNNIIPSTSEPDPTSGTGAITVNNAGLAPVQTQAYDASLEYYFAKTGVFSVGAFKKDFKNFIGTLPAHPATIEELTALGVPNPELYANGGFTIATKTNVGDAGLTGVEFNYSQVLDFGFLPDIIRGKTTIFANGQKMHLTGSTLGDFSNFIRESGSWGVKYGVQRFSAQMNFNYRGRQRMAAQSFAPGAYDYFKPRIYLDANLDVRATKNFGVFINARNLTNVAQDIQRYAATTPSWARTYRREEFGVQYTIGLKGTF